MATAAFRSTSKRSSIGRAGEDTASSAARRRSRSLSRGPARFPPPPPEPSELPTPRGKFVNKARGSGFPEISLDDLADEFFRSKYEDEITPPDRRSSRRMSEISPRTENGEVSRQRGRSVSRRGADGKGFLANGKKSEGFDENSAPRRRQRSVSLARHRASDSESYSSALTDDDAQDVHNSKNRTEKIIRAVYSQKMPEHSTGDGEGTEFYNVMRKEVRNAVEGIRAKLEKVMVKNGTTLANDEDMRSKTSSTGQAIVEIRRKFTTEMEQSEKRKQDLLAKLAAEEERGHELTKIVRELLPAPKQTADAERPSQSRRKSKDSRSRMSQRLTEEAEKYFEDFLSNVEDTDISSFDGERSDTSSGLGGGGKFNDSRMQQAIGEILPTASSLPVETDGVMLPWLQWEASSKSPPSFKSKAVVPASSGKNLFPESQGENPAFANSNHFTSSRGSWSPESNGCSSVVSKDLRGRQSGEVGSHSMSRFSISSSKGSSFDMDEYLHIQRSEDLLFESLRQGHRIDSGGLILCTRSLI
ncbi:hypothetical protein J5N97_006524 [Dioscorea zingiberensis]|uniref:Uncharacterized protein n=1 Tax=Dioscorea zingiberensis TaxID=325984 RepID=A0A9D5DAA8_9LILI|nr:hypothetical protein J5N97_006524 [Dioscorea zingiberensis]